MLFFFLRRLLALIPVSFGVLTIVCFLIHLVPGDPVDRILGDYASLSEKVELREQLGLTQPILTQLMAYIRGIFTGDLGLSLVYQQPVIDLISERVLPTMELAFFSIILALVLSIPLGVCAATQKGKVLDFLAMCFALIGMAIPNFWLGPMLILLFSVHLSYLPVSERAGLASYVLPVVTLGTAFAAFLSRMTRSSMLENLSEDYVKTAKSKGNSYSRLVFVHVLKNASIPIVSVAGLQFGVLLTGAVVTERIFDWPGLGSLMLEGLGNRDYPVVQGCVLVFSFTYLMVNLLTDLLCAMLDPRIKLQR